MSFQLREAVETQLKIFRRFVACVTKEKRTGNSGQTIALRLLALAYC